MDDSSPEAFDPTRRKLCADGACVGVIGDDDRCGECGRTEAEAEAGAERTSPGDGPGADERGSDAGVIDVDIGVVELGVPGSAGFDPTKRRLCDDGGCVGVVGDDGLCRVCGRRAQ
jgi:hypothetical protein